MNPYNFHEFKKAYQFFNKSKSVKISKPNLVRKLMKSRVKIFFYHLTNYIFLIIIPELTLI